eukprot:CAMPEP_0184859768 /NCGR_PEP_ID=MMETSP0580-20130426/4761_1 /TAXON_ID=1118495 /ORGANISM="Dactyliosolen fragilissimus" /LENGTH=535 /DNA_ID=CAMNT_0027356597 /DNA_START=257 /DNA_END=1861 /DNA_ORIENTATION=+
MVGVVVTDEKNENGKQMNRRHFQRYSHSSSSSTSTTTTTTSTSSTSTSISKPTTKEYLKALSELSKARLSALVVSTSTFGFLAATSTPSDYYYTTLLSLTLGTAFCSSSASAWNQIIEHDRDRKMKRTSQRPLVTQTVFDVRDAKWIANGLGLAGGLTLYGGTNVLTTCLGMGNIALYAGAYTFLKPRSVWNTWVGALVGAVPPIMGYTAASMKEDAFVDGMTSLQDMTAWTTMMNTMEPLLLGTTLFLWQFPHFFALNWMHRKDYARGGFCMIATTDTPEGDETARLIYRYTQYLSTLPFLTYAFDLTSSMFLLEGLVLNGYALHVARNFHKERSNSNARKVFFTSLWYLPCWMVLYLLHSNKWKEEDQEGEGQGQQVGEELSLPNQIIPEQDMNNSTHTSKSQSESQQPNLTILQQYILGLKQKAKDVRDFGREMCIHEWYVFGQQQQQQQQQQQHSKQQATTTNNTQTLTQNNPKQGLSITNNNDNDDNNNNQNQCPIAYTKSKAKLVTKATNAMTSREITTTTTTTTPTNT